MPIVPFTTVHLYGETSKFSGSNFRVIPLRWSNTLVLRVYLLYWMAFPFAIGTLTALFCTIRWLAEGSLDGFAPFMAAGWAITLTCGLGYFSLWRTDKRTRQIRRLLGRHQFGTSDPAMWSQDLLTGVRSPQEMFGTESFTLAVPGLLEKGDCQDAMWAARLAVALEDRGTAERLTDEVIRACQGRSEKGRSAERGDEAHRPCD
jgi:hypothetical protein